MNETPTVAEMPQAPTAPDPAAITSLADYEAARPQLLRDSAQLPDRSESADTIRERLLQEQDARAPKRDERGRFARGNDTASADPTTSDAITDDAPVEAVPETPKPARKDPQQRIDRIVWEREQARREAEAARQELAALRAQLQPQAPAETPQAQMPPAPINATDPEPTEEQFETYRDYVRAQAQWAARQQLSQFVQFAQQQAEHQQVEQHRTTAASTFAERMQQAQATQPELLAQLDPDVLNARPSLSLAPGETPTGETAIADLVLHHEQPGRLLTYLSDHKDDFRRIAALHPMLAMRELGRLEARLDAASSGSVSTPSPTSQAKPPIQPVGRGASVPIGARDPKDINSLAEWEAVRKQFGAR